MNLLASIRSHIYIDINIPLKVLANGLNISIRMRIWMWIRKGKPQHTNFPAPRLNHNLKASQKRCTLQ